MMDSTFETLESGDYSSRADAFFDGYEFATRCHKAYHQVYPNDDRPQYMDELCSVSLS